MKVNQLIKYLENVDNKKVYFYDELSKLEFSIDSVKEEDGKIYLEEKWVQN